MGSSVFANGMGISHQQSGAFSTVGPDVCKTPKGNSSVPIPYTNTANSADLEGGSTTVFIQGCPAAIKGCCYSVSTGDEPGSDKGVRSGKVKGKAEFVSYSFDVKIEGKNVCRNGDQMSHNNKNATG
ncbi:MAG: DUF4150 domain-containing protein [Desulfobacterales bacterium]